MPFYHVLKPVRLADGRSAKPGDEIELTARQAKYLVLTGKLANSRRLPPEFEAERDAMGLGPPEDAAVKPKRNGAKPKAEKE